MVCQYSVIFKLRPSPKTTKEVQDELGTGDQNENNQGEHIHKRTGNTKTVR